MHATLRPALTTLLAVTVLLTGCSSAEDAANTSGDRSDGVPSDIADGAEPASATASPSTETQEAIPAEPQGAGNQTDAAAAFPATVATCGTDVTYADAPEAVVLGWPTIMATMEALGVEDTVIGYTSADLAPAPDGDAVAISPDFRTSREVMTATELDMFLVNDENQIDGSAGNLSFDDLTALAAGAYVLGGYCLDEPAPTGLDVVYDDVAALGTVFGVPDDADAVIEDLQGRIEAAATQTQDLEGTTAAVVQVFDGTLFALAGSYYAMIPGALGMESVFADIDANFAEISAEEVLTLSPNTVVVVYDGDDAAADAAVEEITALLADTPAIADGRIATVPNGQLSGGGVSVVEVIEDVADQLS